MKSHPIASRFARVVTGAFNRTETQSTEDGARAHKIDYPPAPKATTPADAWQIIEEHRTNLVAALAAGLFVSRIR